MRAAEIGADTILLLGVGGAQSREPDQLRVHLGFLNHKRIARRDGLHLGIGQSSGVQILKPSDGHVTAHDLGDELRLRLQRLPHVGVKAALGDVAEHLHDGILVSLPENAPFALLHVCRSPRRVQVMQGNQPFLHVRPRPHLLRAAEQDADFARTHITEQRQLGNVRIVILNEGDFRVRDAEFFQLLRHVVIDGEALIFRRREVAKHELGGTLRFGFLPDVENLFDGQIHFALRFVRCGRFHQPEIQSRLPSLGRDFQHVVFAGVNPAVFQSLGAGSERLHELLQLLRGWRITNGRLFTIQLRAWQIQHRGGLHVGGLTEHLHQFRHVDETREARVQPVARSVRRKFHCGHRFAERRRP